MLGKIAIPLAASFAFVFVSSMGANAQDRWRGIEIAPESDCTPYVSNDYRHRGSMEAAIIEDMGAIYSPYTKTYFTSDRDTDIEHIVAKSEAHASGMCSRSASERAEFANDLLNLTLASPKLNRGEKRGKDAAEWTPDQNRCWFAQRVVAVKRKYALTVDPLEAVALEAILCQCEDFEMEFASPYTAAQHMPMHSGRSIGLNGAIDLQALGLHDGLGVNNIRTHLERFDDKHDKQDMVDFLRQTSRDGHVWRFDSRPTVHLVVGMTEREKTAVLEVVRTVNMMLPSDYKLAVAEQAIDPVAHDAPMEGAITIDIIEPSEWSKPEPPESGVAGVGYTHICGEVDGCEGTEHAIYGSNLYIKPRGDTEALMNSILHELVHALGPGHMEFTDHLDERFKGSILLPDGRRDGGAMIDVYGMLALYTSIDPGTSTRRLVDELGPWDDFHYQHGGAFSLHEDGYADVSFGARLYNGLVFPTAAGSEPPTHLGTGSGSVTWNGHILGFTRRGLAVAGDATLQIELDTLRGDLTFADMEQWEPDSTDRTAYGDGDLSYRVEVDGNRFIQTMLSEDDGVVTGSFFGDNHEGMGGTLERIDMAAGFGGIQADSEPQE